MSGPSRMSYFGTPTGPDGASSSTCMQVHTLPPRWVARDKRLETNREPRLDKRVKQPTSIYKRRPLRLMPVVSSAERGAATPESDFRVSTLRRAVAATVHRLPD